MIFIAVLFIGCSQKSILINEEGKTKVTYLSPDKTEIKSYHKNGKIKFEGTYTNGTKDGNFLWVYSNGSVSKKTTYNNGLEEGDYFEFFQNGNIMKKGHFSNGQLNGEWIENFENGRVKSLSFFKNGVQDGQYELYSEDGNLKMESFFVQGKAVYFIEYGENQSIKSEKRIVQIVSDQLVSDTIIVGEAINLKFYVFGPKNWSESKFAVNVYNENTQKKPLKEIPSINDTCQYVLKLDLKGTYVIDVMMIVDKTKAFSGNRKIVVLDSDKSH